MTPKWQKLASLAQEICTLWFQFFSAVFASKGYPFKNIFDTAMLIYKHWVIMVYSENLLNITALKKREDYYTKKLI